MLHATASVAIRLCDYIDRLLLGLWRLLHRDRARLVVGHGYIETGLHRASAAGPPVDRPEGLPPVSPVIGQLLAVLEELEREHGRRVWCAGCGHIWLPWERHDFGECFKRAYYAEKGRSQNVER